MKHLHISPGAVLNLVIWVQGSVMSDPPPPPRPDEFLGTMYRIPGFGRG